MIAPRAVIAALTLAATLFPAAGALPVAAQSLDEAVRANVTLSVRLCLSVMLDRAPARALFEGAGFTYRAEVRGTNEFGVDRGTDHYFDAPAGTAHASVPDIDAFGGLCSIYTPHLDEAALNDVVSAAIFPLFPGAQVRAERDFMLIIQTPHLPLIVQTRTVDRHRYEAPGTVQVTMSYPG